MVAQGEALRARPRQRHVVVVVALNGSGPGCGQDDGRVSFNIEAVGAGANPSQVTLDRAMTSHNWSFLVRILFF